MRKKMLLLALSLAALAGSLTASRPPRRRHARLPQVHDLRGRLAVLRQLRLRCEQPRPRLYHQLLSVSPERRFRCARRCCSWPSPSPPRPSLTTPRTAAAGYYACPICTTYADGSQCCVSCICNGLGQIVACTDHYCPPEGGEIN